jgi:SOS response regulatory protein OraA/RecX
MPLITQILEAKGKGQRRRIYLDGKFAFTIKLNVVARFRLREGMDLSSAQIQQIETGEVRQECLDRAMKYLSGRLHSAAELKRKLLRQEYSPAMIDEILEELKRLGYIDDARFAKTKALSAAQHKHHGPRRAMVELMKAGVKKDVAQGAVGEVYESNDTSGSSRKNPTAKKPSPATPNSTTSPASTDVKEDIRLKMIYPFEHPELAEKFGIRGGGGVLLYGPPGTGKTMLAKATAGEIDATFFRISPADILSKWVGEAEQNIKKLFDAARGEKRAIIFIDEIEALVPARRDEGSSVMQRVVPQILQGMEGFDKKNHPGPVHGRDQRPLAARPRRPPPRPIRREGLHPAARPGRPPQDARHLPRQAPLEDAIDSTPSPTSSTATAAPTSNTSATAPPPSLPPERRHRPGRLLHDTPRSVTREMLGRFESWSASQA